jgi:hypothetical protein
MMLEAFPSRQEFMGLLEELRALREDSNRRFEVIDRRFQELNLHVSSTNTTTQLLECRSIPPYSFIVGLLY